MSKSLVFHLDKVYFFSITKLDRKKLYGWKEIVAFDEKGKECLKVDIDETGSFMIPKGGRALGILNQKGEWVDKKDLVPVYPDGTKATLIESSFNHPIHLQDTVSIEDFLEYKIHAVYLLQSEDMSEAFINQIKDAKEIYTFIFSYRSDYEGSQAFLMESKGNLFMLVGTKCKFEFIGLEQVADISVEEDEEDVSIEEDLDFSMM